RADIERVPIRMLAPHCRACNLAAVPATHMGPADTLIVAHIPAVTVKEVTPWTELGIEGFIDRLNASSHARISLRWSARLLRLRLYVYVIRMRRVVMTIKYRPNSKHHSITTIKSITTALKPIRCYLPISSRKSSRLTPPEPPGCDGGTRPCRRSSSTSASNSSLERYDTARESAGVAICTPKPRARVP